MNTFRWTRQDDARRGAFTLIELLLVITILMILMGMMLPTLSRAKGKGKQASCVNRLKQTAIAMEYYTTDYDGFTVHDHGEVAPASGFWHQQLRASLGDPSSDFLTGSDFFKDPGMPGAYDYSLSDNASSHYMYNDQVADVTGDYGIRLVQAKTTDRTMSVFCGSDGVRVGGVDRLTDLTLKFPHPADRANVLFLDAHVSVLIADEPPALSTDPFWDPGVN